MSASTVQGVKSKSHWDVYVRYGFAGAVCASGAHLILVPIDVVKTRLQVRKNPKPTVQDIRFLNSFLKADR
jgi:hypothetical protein